MLNDSYYLFVEVAAQRCAQLMKGAKPKIDLRAHKYSTVACAEVKEDLIPWRSATDEQLAEEIAAENAAQQAERTDASSVLEPPVVAGPVGKALKPEGSG